MLFRSLGTWRGSASEQWLPGKSTLNQVFMSIQSIILIEHPFFNEPSDERKIGTSQGKKQSESYNRNIRLYTMQHAMSDLIEKPMQLAGFSNVIKNHFKLKKDHILKITREWTEAVSKETLPSVRQAYEREYKRLEDNLNKL